MDHCWYYPEGCHEPARRGVFFYPPLPANIAPVVMVCEGHRERARAEDWAKSPAR